LKEAMSHDSLRANNSNLRDYQRLEHLGDAVLHFVISNYLFCKHPDWNERDLSNERDSLVKGSKQKEIAETLELQKFVKMSSGVQMQYFSRIDKFLEALIGAVYIDAGGEQKGYPDVKKVIYKLWNLQLQEQVGCVMM
jgi:ribonuclease-3